ncbi:acyltransferase, partial [Natronospira sp.]|uniref:acyltransferase n=1 Tax=Natronospira sp. TaxID=2024970 RepID=UPI0038732EF7
ANLQVFAQQSVTIEDDVMFASNVFLNDGSHGYQTATVPYKYQPIFRIAPIVVGRGSWIGQNVVIMPGVTIGEHAIIGANSVVTASVPPRCIAAGSPARVLKLWDERQERWVHAGEHSDRTA